MPPKILRQYCEYALTVLNSQFQATKVITHTSTTGTIREQLIKDFLKAHLPELVTVLSGQIFDSENNYSKQQDIVLVMKSMPRLPFTVTPSFEPVGWTGIVPDWRRGMVEGRS